MEYFIYAGLAIFVAYKLADTFIVPIPKIFKELRNIITNRSDE